MHVLDGQPEQLGGARLRQRQALRRHVDRQRLALPGDHDRMRLHRIVILRRRLIGPVDARDGSLEARLDIADTRLGRGEQPDRGGHEALGAVEAGARRLCLVARAEQRRSLRRGLQRLGDHHRDRLPVVAHAIVLQRLEADHEGLRLGVRVLRERRPVLRRHHLDDAGMRLGGFDVEEDDAAARDAADREHRMDHSFRDGCRRRNVRRR